MNKTLCFFALIFLFISCKNHRTGISQAEMYIDVPETIDNSFVDVVSEYGLLPLEATDNSLLSVISKIRIYKNHIYLLDGYESKRLMIFDRQGKYIAAVGQRGRGPNEYTDLTNFEIDYLNDELMLCDDPEQKLLVYDLNGDFKYAKRISKPITNVARLKNGNLVLGYGQNKIRANNHYTLAVCDPDGNIIATHIKNITEPFGLDFASSDMMISHPSGLVSFMPQFNDVIYHINENNVTPYWGINFSKGTSNISNMEKINTPQEFYSDVKGMNYLLGEHAENDDYVYVLNKDGMSREHIIYEKKSRKVRRISNHLIGQHIVIDEEGYFWSYVSEPALHFMNDEIATEIKNLRADADNLTLIYYKLKDF